MANVGICENHFGGKMELILSVVEERRTGNLGFLVVPNHPTVAFIVGSEGPILLSAFVRDPMWMMVENIAGLLCSRRGTRHLIELANWVERTLTIGVTPAEKCYTLSADPHKCLASYPLADMELHLWDIGCAKIFTAFFKVETNTRKIGFKCEGEIIECFDVLIVERRLN